MKNVQKIVAKLQLSSDSNQPGLTTAKARVSCLLVNFSHVLNVECFHWLIFLCKIIDSRGWAIALRQKIYNSWENLHVFLQSSKKKICYFQCEEIWEHFKGLDDYNICTTLNFQRFTLITMRKIGIKVLVELYSLLYLPWFSLAPQRFCTAKKHGNSPGEFSRPFSGTRNFQCCPKS